MAKKIGDKIAVEFWDRLEFWLRIGETNIQFKGWQAALMRELMVNGAAMTVNGAHSLVLANGAFKIGSRSVARFLNKMCDEGRLKVHKERKMKGKRRKRIVFTSALEPGQFLYQIIVHKEEE